MQSGTLRLTVARELKRMPGNELEWVYFGEATRFALVCWALVVLIICAGASEGDF